MLTDTAVRKTIIGTSRSPCQGHLIHEYLILKLLNLLIQSFYVVRPGWMSFKDSNARQHQGKKMPSVSRLPSGYQISFADECSPYH